MLINSLLVDLVNVCDDTGRASKLESACYAGQVLIRSGHLGSRVENETGHSVDLESVIVDELGHSGSRNRNRGWIAIFAHSNLGFRSRNLAH